MSEATALADLVLAAHALVAVAVFGGLVVAIAGIPLGWRWSRSNVWRVPHLLVTVYLFLRSNFALPCPFSVWEDSLRSATGAPDSSAAENILRVLSFRNLDAISFHRAMTAFAFVTVGLFVLQRSAARSSAPAARERSGAPSGGKS